MTLQNLPTGVLFDMDGVLVDSEPYIAKAGCMLFAEKGLEVTPADFEPFIGTGDKRYVGGVAEKYNFPLDSTKAKTQLYDIYLELIKGQLKPLPGVIDFLNKCKTMNKKIAVATSADLRKAQGNLTEMGLTIDYFDTVVTAEDIKHKKPDPEIFLLAAKRLSLNPCDCLVIEDAVSGVASAKSAGAKCLAITSTFTVEQLSDADFFAPDLAEVDGNVLNWQ